MISCLPVMAQHAIQILKRLTLFNFCISTTTMVWVDSLTVTCQTCNPEVTQRRRFDSAPGHCRVTTLGKLFTYMCLCHQAV